jgi:hypothetical protein
MNKILYLLNIIKLKKKLKLLKNINFFLKKKKINIFLINYQKGIFRYFYTGKQLKNFKYLLKSRFNIYRKKDQTIINLLIFSPTLIYFF